MTRSIPHETFIKKIQNDLNPPQQEAATYTRGPMMVLAGAGSGKTRVITYRITYLIHDLDIPPWNILAVTFTNKAADEMKERVGQLLHGSPRGLWIGTFHSICARILRMDGKEMGIDPQFTIYDRGDQVATIKQAVERRKISSKNLKPNVILNAISRAKSNYLTPAQWKNKMESDRDEIIVDIYEEYQKVLKKNNALDFDDLLMKTVLLLEQHEKVRKIYSQRFRHIMVDEYQDTNHLQYMMIKLLGEQHQNVCVVGDDDQSIYRWRGATIRNILDFEKDYPKAKKIKLEQNYRSTQTILSAATALVRHNKGRHEKTLWSASTEGEKIGVVRLPEESSEAYWIGDQIQTLHEEEKVPYHDIAIFYRTNAQSRLFEEECMHRRIPYHVVGAVAFYERKEIKDILAYCRLLVNPADTVSFLRIVNEPKRKLGKVSTGKLLDFADRYDLPILEAARQAREAGMQTNMAAKTCEAFYQFAHLFQHWKNQYRDMSLGELMEAIMKDSGYRDMFESSRDPQEAARLENLDEILNAAAKFGEELQRESDSTVDAITAMETYLQDVSLVSDTDNLDVTEDTLTLMTLHSAKGLEFPYVFITGIEHGLLPHKNSIYDPEALEEERRLCYVGITRAQRKIFMTYAECRRMYGNTEITTPSEFLDEIPKEYLEEVHWRGYDIQEEAAINRELQRAQTFAPYDDHFQAGDMVNHRSFGFGVVTGIEGEGPSARITIDFQEIGKKVLIQEYAKLQKV